MPRLKLSEHIALIAAATTIDAIEAAMQAAYREFGHGRSGGRIARAAAAACHAVAESHPHGHLLPRYDGRGGIGLLGERYRIGRSGNAAGASYAWGWAADWMRRLLREQGLGIRAAHRISEAGSRWPHRTLRTIEEAVSGQIPDPVPGRLHYHEPMPWSQPINYSVEKNDASSDRRATRRCRCGGRLFDWGAGHSDGFDYIQWHCSSCPATATQYLGVGQLEKIRRAAQRRSRKAAPALAA